VRASAVGGGVALDVGQCGCSPPRAQAGIGAHCYPARKVECVSGETLALWAATEASADVVTSLEASLWQRSVPLRTPGKNPRSPDRMVVALLRRDLLEDAILESSRHAALCYLGG
jgi:hypothetical protein